MLKPSVQIFRNASPQFMTIRISLQNANATTYERLNLIGQQAMQFIEQRFRQAMAGCPHQRTLAEEIIASLELHLTKTMAIIHCAHPQCSQVNRNSALPCHAFFDLYPREVEVLNNLLNSKAPNSVMQKPTGYLSYGDEECWTRTDNSGNSYVTCDGGDGGGGEGGSSKKESSKQNTGGKDSSKNNSVSSKARLLDSNPGGENGPKITFDPPSGGKSINQPINPALASAVEKVAKDLKVDLRISSTTGGHTSGNHVKEKAVDIARINDARVSKDSGKILDDVMKAFRDMPSVYQVLDQGIRGIKLMGIGTLTNTKTIPIR